jgi:hypothetical protein
MSSAVYQSVLISKNGFPVPVFFNGHSMHSRYDPVREGEKTASLIKGGCNFFLIAGVGGAYFINSLRRLYPESIILAAENSCEDIKFLRQIPSFREAEKDTKIVIFPVEETTHMLLRYYLPCVYGSLQIIEHQSWAAENTAGIAEFRKQVDEASKIISADFSVQVHFGRIWQRNILMNLKNFSPAEDIRFPVNKTALIAAAGPSLDMTASYITGHRSSLYIIATDTAFSSFIQRDIHCDAVVSIDGQFVSHNHFLELTKVSSDTLFIFDLCANPAAVRAVQKKGCTVLFIHTGHPLSQYASQYATHAGNNSFMQLESGSGTVTIAAADFAVQAGFSHIITAGADFSYLNGKAYMKGTYLDMLYNKESSRVCTSETTFDRLLFRTPLIPYGNSKKRFTTTVLESYNTTFEQWLAFNKIKKEEKQFLKFYSIESKKYASVYSVKSFDFSSFIKYMQTDFSEVDFSSLLPGRFPPVILSLLPAAAYFKAGKPEYYRNFKFFINLAYSEILRYT